MSEFHYVPHHFPEVVRIYMHYKKLQIKMFPIVVLINTELK